MIADLLRLASIGQNMELYASLQLRQPHNQNQNLSHHHHQLQSQQASQRRLHHHQHKHRSHRQHSIDQQQQQEFSDQHQASAATTCKQQQAQCGPLDLSVKSVQISANHQVPDDVASVGDDRLAMGGALPLTLNLCVPHTPIKVSNQLDKRRLAQQAGSRAPKTPKAAAPNCQLKLITSSTSPSSCSRSASSSVSSLLEESISSSSASSGAGQYGAKNSEVISSTNAISNTSCQLAGGPNRRQKHKGMKSHLCHQCGRSFSRSDMLTRHSRLHSGLKPYQCIKCKQVFSRSDHLSTHERTHTGEKPYQCEYCAYSACRRDMITRHMRTHSGASSGNVSLLSQPPAAAMGSMESPPTDNAGQTGSPIKAASPGSLSSPGSGGRLLLAIGNQRQRQHDDDISTSSLDDGEEDNEMDNDLEEADEGLRAAS